MSLKYFLKGNKIKRENQFYAASQAFKDESGETVEWELKPITTKENEKIREACMTEVPVAGKPNMYKPKLNYAKYAAKLIASAVVYPNLNDKELQDSYGVMSAEELVVEMLDNPNEYNGLMQFISDANGFTESFQDKVEEAKN